jgi:hypothetical protein
MAIYHLNASTGSREGGQSAAKKFDYIARRGDYSRQEDRLVHLVSGNLPAWAEASPREYWRAADVYERANGRLFKQIEAALPRELTHEQRVDLAESFARAITALPGGVLPFTLGLHEGKSDTGEEGNPHFHLIINERINDGLARSDTGWFKRAAVGKGKEPKDGGAPKTDALKPKEWLIGARKTWADMCNQALLKAGSSARVDHRSFVDQGIEKPAPVHLGPTACAFERRTGEVSRRRRDAEARDRREKEEIDSLQVKIDAAKESALMLSAKSAAAMRLLAGIERQEAADMSWTENGFDLAAPLANSEPHSSDLYKVKQLPSGAILHLRMPVDRVAFVEHKSHIRMSKTDAMNPDSVSEAIQVACSKWGSIEATGSPEFKKLVFEKATELGLAHLIVDDSAPPPKPKSAPPLRVKP